MDVFELDQRLIEQYEAFARSFTKIRSTELSAKVDAFYTARRFWPEKPLKRNANPPLVCAGSGASSASAAQPAANPASTARREIRRCSMRPPDPVQFRCGPG